MKTILILGAGRSASSLIDYLIEQSSENGWQIRIGDFQPALAQQKVADYSFAEAFSFDVFNEQQRAAEVEGASLVISLLPSNFHGHVAKECLKYKKPLFTASYISEEFVEMAPEVEQAGLLFMMECGLDPGIDHMTAMQAVDNIKRAGGKLISFKSYAGGLVAPESDTNPWRYKFTWNPRNVVLAGQGTAQFIRNNRYKYIPYHRLFSRLEHVEVEGLGSFEAYPNRDSLRYRKVYDLGDIPTMLRGTLRRPGFSMAWNVLVQLGITDDTYRLEDSANMTYRQFINSFLAYHDADSVENKLCAYTGISRESEEFKKVEWLGLFEEERIGLENASPAQILQKKLEEKWYFGEEDRDMIVMQHQLEYELEGTLRRINSSMVSMADSGDHTAMAKTVGLPLAMAAKNYLQGKINLVGVHRPVMAEVYDLVLEELTQYNIAITETEEVIG